MPTAIASRPLARLVSASHLVYCDPEADYDWTDRIHGDLADDSDDDVAYAYNLNDDDLDDVHLDDEKHHAWLLWLDVDGMPLLLKYNSCLERWAVAKCERNQQVWSTLRQQHDSVLLKCAIDAALVNPLWPRCEYYEVSPI